MAPNRRKNKASSAAAAAAAAKRQWKVGDLVLAKVKGFPAWPAVVSDPTKWGYAVDWKKVMVFFYGTSQIAFCNPADVESFTEEKKESLLGKRHGKGADYVRAVKEIIDSYEGLVKNNELDDSNAVNEVDPANAGNLRDSLASSRLKDQTESSQATFVSQLNGDDTMDKDGVSSLAEDAVANASHDRETSSEEPTDNVVMAETALTTTYSTRKRSGSIQQNSQLKKRRDLRSRTLKSHNLVVSSNDASKNVKDITSNEVQDAIVGMNRLIKGSPAASDSHVASSPADISTGSIKDNGSEIVTVDSDYLSLNDGSTFEFGKNLEHGEGEQEFGKQPDFQIKAHVVKKKRKPNRKRVASDACAVLDNVDEDVEIDISEEKLPNVCDKLDISICKEDGDEHLPLVKRARVRMGKHAAIEEKLDHFMKMEENSTKNGPVHTSSNFARDSFVDKDSLTVMDNVVKSSPSSTCLHLPEFSTKNGPVNEPVQTSSNRAQDSFVDKESLTVKDNVVKSSPSTCLHLPETSTNNGPVNEPVQTSSNRDQDSFVDKESLMVKDNVVKSSPSTCLHLPETSTNNGPVNEPVHTSSNIAQDSFVDKESLTVKNNMVKSSSLNTCHHLSENSILGCESRKNQAFGSLDGEAALPPSKRLHRALEAMSANVAEDDLACAQTPLNNGSCVSPIECHHEPSGSKSENTLEKHYVECNGQFASKTDSAQFSVDVNFLVLDESKSYSVDVEPNETAETSRGQCEIAQSVVMPYIANKVSPSLDGRNDTFRNNQDSVDQLSSKTEEKSEIMSSSPNKAELPIKNAETTECSTMSIDHISEDNVIKGSPQNGASVHLFYEEGSCCDNTQSWKIPLDGGSQTASMCQTVRETSDKSSQFAEKVLTPISGANNSYDSASISDDVLSVKDVTGIQSSSSTADRASVPARDSPSFNSLYHKAKTGSNKIVQNNGCGSPASKLHEERRKTARSLDVNEEKADSAVTSVGKSHADTAACLTSFETLLGGLTRAKESIGRATRIAIDCAKYGASSKVLNILARHMENEPSLSKRVDFFFLVDSITQCSRGLKGDVHGAFASAVQSVLPRLLAAAAPPGNTARENRRQCLKVLRLWMERRTLPESIVQHHMRHLDSLNWSSCPGAASRRPLRNERAFDDPLREMEGMLVDEYGSNSSLQLQGLSMPHMLKVEDDGSDSDGGSFEAVTPEHNSETPEVQEPTPTVGKYKHILEDVDGELEMEDVAPSCETVTSTFNEVSIAHTPNPKQYIPSSLPPPLPNDIPPSSPPLPTSPPPLPPPPPPLPLPPSAYPGTYTNSADAKPYLGTNNMPGNVPVVCHEPMNYNMPECQNYRMDTRLPDSSATCSFGNFDGSHVPMGRLNNVPQTDAEVMHNKACHLPPPPPPPPPSNHFSYAHADPQVHSWRDAPYPHYSNRHHFPPNMDGAYYTDHDRSNVHEFSDRSNIREFNDRPPREFIDRPNPREFNGRSNPREFHDRSNPREFNDRSNPHEFNERSSSHEFNERWRYNEPSFSDPYYPHDRARGPPAPRPHFQGEPYRTRNQGWSHHSPEMRYRNAMTVRPPCEDNRYWGPR